jgi:mono/diheme cytochrome c family protein
MFKFLLWCIVAISLTFLVITVTLADSLEATLALNSPPNVRASSPSQSPTPQATPIHGMMFAPDERLARPHMSDPPTQVELGHYRYYMSCMVCHGDRGQGLTDEWRGVLDPEDQNCWQSRCHAPNHPPEGFQLPRSSPPIIGAGTLGAYQTAADLHAYLRVEMPWPFPGLFDDEEYWRVTAYLADVNKVDMGKKPLGLDNARKLLMRPKLIQTHQSALGIERIVTVVVLALLLGTVTLQRWTRARR